MIVGDSDQSIFGFRGTSTDSLDRLMKYLDPQVFDLKDNFRSGQCR